MDRNIIDAAVFAKIESVYATDSVPTGTENAVRCYAQSIETLVTKYIPREYLRGFGGGFEELVGAIFKKVSFTIELAGSGAAGTAPAYGHLLRACSWAETVSAGARVEYTPISSAEESCTIYYFDSGVMHKLLGSKGDWELTLLAGDKPGIKFNFTGLDGGEVEAATPAQTLTAYKAPEVVTSTNTGDVTIGCTYATGALSGGTTYPSKGLSIKGSNSPAEDELLGGDSIIIDRKGITSSIEFKLTAAQEVAFSAIIRTSTLQSIGLSHGTAAGKKIIVFAPSVQFKNPKSATVNGKRRIGYDLSVLPLTGNDDIRLVVL